MTLVAQEYAPAAPSLPTRPVGQRVQCGSIQWHLQTMGAGPPLLLVHGTGASSHSFRHLMPLLAAKYTVFAPDLPGHALSRAPASFRPSLGGMAEALRSLLAVLGVQPVAAIGHSAGAAVLARMTLDKSIAPRLLVGLGAALVPFRGVARAVLPPAARLLAIASRLIDVRIKGSAAVERMVQRTGSTLDRAGVEYYRALSEDSRHVAATLSMMAHWQLEGLFDDLRYLETPFLLLGGVADRAVPLSDQGEAAARAPKGRLVVVEGAGHLLHEEKPEVVANLVLAELCVRQKEEEKS